jgi:hypothetical protein
VNFSTEGATGGEVLGLVDGDGDGSFFKNNI